MYLKVNKNKTHIELPHVSLHEEFIYEKNHEDVCLFCDLKMKPNSNKISYDCEICGFHHRKRTNTEIFRDIKPTINEPL